MVPWHSQILRAVDSNALLIADISWLHSTLTLSKMDTFAELSKCKWIAKNLKIWKKGLSTQKMNNLCVSPENY
jgi:hypothetical protein